MKPLPSHFSSQRGLYRQAGKKTRLALPVLLALALITWLNLVLIATKISTPFPNSPWESAILCDAWRMGHHQVIYADVKDVPAPMMYGPLTPCILGNLFRIGGVNFWMGRTMSLLSSLLATGLIAFALTRSRPHAHFFAGWAFLAGVNLCSKNYFVEIRPDMESLLCSVAALLLMYRAHVHQKWSWYVAGILMLTVAFLFKQTAAMYAAIPPIVCLLDGKGTLIRTKAFFAVLPLVSLLMMIGVLKVFFPWAYHYLIGANSGQTLGAFNLVVRTLQLFSLAPLFLTLLLDWMVSGGEHCQEDTISRWVFACFVIVVPASLITAAPSGGDLNALIPAWLVMAAFCVHRSARIETLLIHSQTTFRIRLFSSIVVAVLILISTLGQLPTALTSAFMTHGDFNYSMLIKDTAALRGTVACPQDPTIPLFAKGYAGRSIYAEYAHSIENGEWPSSPPQPVLDEIKGANYVIQLHSHFGNLVTDHLLEHLGFRMVSTPSTTNSCYALWKQTPALK